MTEKFEIVRVYVPGLPPKYQVEGDPRWGEQRRLDSREEAEARRAELIEAEAANQR